MTSRLEAARRSTLQLFLEPVGRLENTFTSVHGRYKMIRMDLWPHYRFTQVAKPPSLMASLRLNRRLFSSLINPASGSEGIRVSVVKPLLAMLFACCKRPSALNEYDANDLTRDGDQRRSVQPPNVDHSHFELLGFIIFGVGNQKVNQTTQASFCAHQLTLPSLRSMLPHGLQKWLEIPTPLLP
jgi:hypothetical protein